MKHHPYSSWIQDLLGAALPEEPRATCSDCAMCRRMEPETPADAYFKPNVKCCSFLPALPNYLVGAILSDDSPEFSRGRAQFEREAVKACVTPLGVSAPVLYNWLHQIKSFGTAEILLCPYYRNEQGGECSIWQYRNAHCATWFCRFERGRTGYEFWRSIEQLFSTVEGLLADRFARQLGTRPDLSASLDEAWGPWAGNARDFYVRCAQLVAPMKWNDIVACFNRELNVLAGNAVAAFRALGDTGIPHKLRSGEFRSEKLDDNRLRIWGYSKYDPIDVSAETAAALASLERHPGIELRLEPALLRRLFDMRVLIPE